MTTNARAHTRHDVRLSADAKHEGHSFTATTRNLSAGGVCLESSYPFTENAPIRLDLFMVIEGIEDERMPPLTVEGSVQWTADDDEEHTHVAGVQFTAITDAQARWLEQFLAKTGQE